MSGGQKTQCWCGALLGTKGHPEPHAAPPPIPGSKVRVPRGMPENPHVFYPGLNQPGESGQPPAGGHSHAGHTHGHDFPQAGAAQPASAPKPAPPPSKGTRR
jgi:hypothetical protein